MNEKVENRLAGGPFGAVEQPSKNSGGGAMKPRPASPRDNEIWLGTARR